MAFWELAQQWMSGVGNKAGAQLDKPNGATDWSFESLIDFALLALTTGSHL